MENLETKTAKSPVKDIPTTVDTCLFRHIPSGLTRDTAEIEQKYNVQIVLPTFFLITNNNEEYAIACRERGIKPKTIRPSMNIVIKGMCADVFKFLEDYCRV